MCCVLFSCTGTQSAIDIGKKEPLFTTATALSIALWFLILAIPLIQVSLPDFFTDLLKRRHVCVRALMFV